MSRGSPSRTGLWSPATDLRSSSSYPTGVTVIEPDVSQQSVRSPRSPPRTTSRRSETLPLSSSRTSSGGSDTESVASIETNITYGEPESPEVDLSSLYISTASSPACSARTPSAPSSASTPSSGRGSDRPRRRKVYASQSVQTALQMHNSTPPTPRATPPHSATSTPRVTHSSMSTPRATPPPTTSTMNRSLARSHSEGHDNYCQCHAPAPATCGSCQRPIAPPSTAVSSPQHVSRTTLNTPRRAAPLSPLGLGLMQPMHASNLVYEGAQDPRSPMHRSTPTPSTVPVFHRPSPSTSTMSISATLFVS
ncbi:uncharacterized protein FIBRA_07580 [Fibroporia radiculosa]|uniref:Uncharacterized protein n=1 Tax=Fibroporia radiculosa TaxID=599839 RepID=J4GV94_9APHY|nr:uncharacterized protein FIBRA_07580 [Fibroporia radiculosa]CCM05365.1 predicted protein [Fibroporia radiculosa]